MQNHIRCFKRLAPFTLLAVALLLGGIAVKSAHASVIERIEINQVGNEAEIQLQFISRIQYLREASLKNGDVRLYFNLLEVDASDPRLVTETSGSPPSKIVPRFTVTYPELDSSLAIRFGKVVAYRISPGSDGRSISIFIPSLIPKSEPAPKALPVVSVPVTVIAVPVVVPSVPVVVPSAQATSKAEPPQAAAPAPPQVKPTPSKVVAPAPAIKPIPPQVKPAETPSLATPASAAEIETEAKLLIGNARDALRRGQSDVAIETLNRLLNLPPNQQSQAAQELIGEAREKSGELAKARLEYQLYLKLYPTGPGVERVKDRLAKLPMEVQAKPAPRAVQKKTIDEKMTIFGGFSQSYYKGVSHTDTTANGLTESFDSTDQSMLISSLDLTGRKRTESTDTRIVFRDDYKANFLPKTKNDNRLNAFYVEQSAQEHTYLYRLGRQRGSAGGAPSRFDGAWLSYSPSPVWRLNGVIGTPVELTGSGLERKTFSGVSIDITRLPEQWSGSGYFVQQRVGSVLDRQAIGMETHYFDTQRNYLGLVEYDRLFKAFNIAMLQANWKTEAGDDYLFLADHRKSPSLQITNALPAQTTPSIAALVQSGVSTNSLIADAKALTPVSNLLMIGMTHPFSPRFRMSGDFRVTNISGTGAAGVGPAVAAAAGSGNIYIITTQAIGNSLLRENDLGLTSASYIKAPTYTGQSLAFNLVETLRENWRLDGSLQFYNQNDNLEAHQVRITPSLKLSYRWSESISLDGEGGIEDTHTNSPTKDERIRRKYFYLGYRWDFR